ncbi:membrane protein required for colicin V production [Orenia metallireducens]|uniref:Membrane protein required for colicin V production n=1 Tax=Orenia metallireducens TaxID=1413210 RepID=A0A285I8D2_9FIRM|nr:CvpA family protein [Orenia metallireducens]PRX21663.1 membrane protein required for colicin V production [Orenia metallireducens]SNY44214.1 membrane protein required for colicin V production [Orenia metallireducens]
MEFNLIDIVVIILAVVFMVKGYRLGLIKQLTAILAIIIAIYVAQEQYTIIAEFLVKEFDLALKLGKIISFFLIVVIVTLLINYIGYFLTQLLDIIFLSFIDNFGGLLFGLIKGILILYIGLLLLNIIPIELLEKEINQSYFAPKILSFSSVVDKKIEEFSK